MSVLDLIATASRMFRISSLRVAAYFCAAETAHWSSSGRRLRRGHCIFRQGTAVSSSSAINIARRSSIMDIDQDRIDEAVLALLFLGHHDGMRTWKSFDWDAMERLHAKGMITDPVGK